MCILKNSWVTHNNYTKYIHNFWNRFGFQTTSNAFIKNISHMVHILIIQNHLEILNNSLQVVRTHRFDQDFTVPNCSTLLMAIA